MLLLQLFDFLADGAAFTVGTANKGAADIPETVIFFYHDGARLVLFTTKAGNIPFHVHVSFPKNCKHYYTEKEGECKGKFTCKELAKMV